MRGHRRLGPSAAAAIAAALLLASCSRSSPGATGSPSPTVPASTAPATPTAPTSPSPVPRCTIGQLEVAFIDSGGAAGSIRNTVAFRNVSASTCSLYGYPGMQLLDSSGASLPTKVVRGSSVVVPSIAPRPVTLAPGKRAAYVFGYSDVPTGSQTCPPAAQLEVTPPNDFSHKTIPVSMAPCGGVLTTSPVFAGVTPPSS